MLGDDAVRPLKDIVQSPTLVDASPVEALALAVPTLAEVYTEHARRVGGWAARLMGPGLDPEDLIHEVFLIVDRELPHWRGEAKITTWLYRITLNVVRDRRRREKRRWLRTLLFGEQQEATPVFTPYDSVEQRQLTASVYAALDKLAERDRTLLILFEIEGLSGEAIADLLAIKIDTLWVFLHRARKRFRARIESDFPELAKQYGRQSNDE